MRKYSMNGIKKCQEMIDWMFEHGYYISQLQYGADKPEGFYIWFRTLGNELEEIEIHTFKPEIQNMLVKYKKAPTS